ncbi:DUF6551 family protein, partial [Anaerobutyricum hallii]|uniref:DUF6551 family protein n=1 Tax=Anaerobutyricum hallii TaxID=39488 RepID=UPI00356467A1
MTLRCGSSALIWFSLCPKCLPENVANEPKVSFRNGQFIVTDGQHTIEGRIL